MKLIAVTQRVDKIESYKEIRDSLDERWTEFLLKCNLIPIIIPNNLEAASKILETVRIHGILLTGGNSEVKYGGDAPQRDAIDEFLIEYATKKEVPLLGVCRGMQSILSYFGENLYETKNHVAVNHKIFKMLNKDENRIVNSYHTLSASYDKLSNSDWTDIYISEDGVVESIAHKNYKLYGMMWHPERNNVFDMEDERLFNRIYGV